MPDLGSEWVVPLALLKIVDIMVSPTTPPNGRANVAKHVMRAVMSGKYPRECKDAGFIRSAIPWPMSAIMP
jgi:hypothetical protein